MRVDCAIQLKSSTLFIVTCQPRERAASVAVACRTLPSCAPGDTDAFQ